MQIKRSPPKKLIQAPKLLQEFITKATQVEEAELPALLESFGIWSFPRSDLYHWIPVLNRFDAILTRLVDSYDLKNAQNREFTSGDKRLLIEVLKFSAFLMDHCANRSIYSSSNVVAELFITTEPEVLYYALNLEHRLAIRAGNPLTRVHRSSTLHVPHEKLFKLLRYLPSTPNVSGVAQNYEFLLSSADEGIPDDWSNLCFPYYRQKPQKESVTDAPSTPKDYGAQVTTPKAKQVSTVTPKSKGREKDARRSMSTPLKSAQKERSAESDEGVVLYEYPPDTVRSLSVQEMFATVTSQAGIKQSANFDLVCAIMKAKYVGDVKGRRYLVAAGLLALASLPYVVTENVMVSKLDVVDHDVATHLAGIISREAQYPDFIKISALCALRGLVQHRTTSNQVLTALGATVSHGIFMSLFTDVIDDMEQNTGRYSMDFVSELFQLLFDLVSRNHALIQAGIIGKFVRIMKISCTAASGARVAFLAVSNLDYLVRQYDHAFHEFLSRDGLAVLVDLIKCEVTRDVENFPQYREMQAQLKTMDYNMDYERASLLKMLLRFILSMMDMSGTSGELRNLIDSSLLGSLKTIFDYHRDFVSSSFALAANIMSSFIHNEPLSYGIIHEANLSDAFLQSLNKGILPSGEVVLSITGAIGAICLNQAGRELLESSGALRSYFSIFTSDEHARSLADYTSFWSAIEELFAHHPFLRELSAPIFSDVLDSLLVKANNVSRMDESGKFIYSVSQADVEMKDENADHGPLSPETMASFFCMAFRFLFMPQVAGRPGYEDNSYYHRFFMLLTPPSMPHYVASADFGHLAHLYSRPAVKDPQKMFESLISMLQGVMDDKAVQSFVKRTGFGSSFFLKPGVPISDQNEDVLVPSKELVTSLNALLNILCFMSSVLLPMYSHPRENFHYSAAFMYSDSGDNILHILGHLQRVCLWEEAILCAVLPRPILNATDPSQFGPADEKQGVDQSGDVTESNNMIREIQEIRFVVSQFATHVTSVMQCLAKTVITRRTPDTIHRQNAFFLLRTLAIVLQTHLVWVSVQRTSGTSDQYYNYLLVTLSSIKSILVEDQKVTSTVQTLLLQCMSDCGALDDLSHLLCDLWSKMSEFCDDPENKNGSKEELLARMSGSAKVILDLFGVISTSKNIVDAPQSLALNVSNASSHSGYYFSSPSLISACRSRILRTVYELWTKKRFDVPTSLLKVLLQLLTKCMRLDNQKSSVSSEPRKSYNLSKDENDGKSAIDLLKNLGYSQAVATSALASVASIETPKQDASSAAIDSLKYIGQHPVILCAGIMDDLPASSEGEGTCDSEHPGIVEADNAEDLSNIMTDISNDSGSLCAMFDSHADIAFEAAEFLKACFIYRDHDVKWFSKTYDYVESEMKKRMQAKKEQESEQSEQISKHSVSACIHMLAILAHDTDIQLELFHAILPYTDLMLELLSSDDESVYPHCLLILESILAIADRPSKVGIRRNGKLLPPQKDYSVDFDLQEKIFSTSLRVLARKPADENTLTGLFMILLRQTKVRTFADRFVNEGNLRVLLAVVATEGCKYGNSILLPSISIIRHLVETLEVQRKMMETGIRRWFKPDGRARYATSVISFFHGCSGYVLRNPKLFVEVANDMCKLSRYREGHIEQQIVLRNENAEPVEEGQEDVEDYNSTQQQWLKDPGNGITKEVIHSLLSELLSQKDENILSGFEISDVSEDGTTNANDVSNESATFEPKKHPKFVYRRFLIQCISELVSNYDATKLEVINYSRKGSSRIAEQGTPVKPRSTIINYLLNDLLPIGSLIPSNEKSEKLSMLLSISGLAMTNLVCLCAPTSFYSARTSSLQLVRKVVIEATAKAIRDTMSSSDSAEVRYSRMAILAELARRLSSGIGTADGLEERVHQSHSKEMTKLMIEKNFVPLLTSIISEVDVNYPSFRKIIRYLIRSLKVLTMQAVKLSDELNLPAPESLDPDDQYEISTESSSSDDDDAERLREDTPDLYRNSALGMLHGVVEEDGPSSSELDQYEYDDEESDGFEEEAEDDASAVSEESMDQEVSADEDDMQIELMLNDGEDDVNDAGSEGDEEIDDESEEDRETDIDDGFDDSDMEEDDDLMPESIDISLGQNSEDDDESAWQTETNSEGSSSNDAEDMQEVIATTRAPRLGHRYLMIDEGGDNADEEEDIEDGINSWISDEDDIGDQLDDIEQIDEEVFEPVRNEGPFGITWGENEDGILGVRRGSLPVPEFVRPYSTASQDASMLSIQHHPLLQASSSGQVSGVPESLGARRASRDEGSINWIQSIEDLIGDGAVQLLGDVMRRVRQIRGDQIIGSGPSTIHVEMTRGPPGNVVSRDINDLLGRNEQRDTGSRRSTDTIKYREILPATSYARWQDEARMLFGVRFKDYADAVAPQLLELLIPLAIKEEEDRRREAEAKERERAEQQRKKEEEDRKAEEEERKKHEERENESSKVAVSDTEDAGASASQSRATRERITITLRGTEVDITDLGVDKDFLEALPEDMREEVLTQHIQERRAQDQTEEESEISHEFLNALPQDIRDELLVHEALERRRREQSHQRHNMGDGATGSDYTGYHSGSDFEAGQPLAMESEIGLPERTDVIEYIPNRLRNGRNSNNSNASHPEKERKKLPVPLLDKSGVAAIIRLFFLPLVPRTKSTLESILQHICSNRVNRAEVINLLLLIIQEGVPDIQAMDRLFMQLATRGRSSGLMFQHGQKKKGSSNLLNFHSEDPALLVVHQCIDALDYLVSNNEHLPSYFLSEHGMIPDLRKSANRKGKELASKTHDYPVNTLLRLLDQPTVLGSSLVLERFAHVLQVVTRPLLNLIKQSKSEEKAKTTDQDDMQVSTTGEGSVEISDDTRSGPQSNILNAEEDKDKGKKAHRRLKPPYIPFDNMRLVVNIVTAGDCSSKAFQSALVTIMNLGALEGARDMICDELVKHANSFISELSDDLVALGEQISRDPTSIFLRESRLMRFTQVGSAQTKLLRVLKTIDYIFGRKARVVCPGTETRSLEKIYGSLQFLPLWAKLSKCLTLVSGQDGKVSSEAVDFCGVLLPLIESLMVICEGSTATEMVRPAEFRELDSTSDREPSTLEAMFFSFTDRHREILNTMVRNTPMLMSGSFALLMRNSRVLDFDNKRNYFDQKLHSRKDRKTYPSIAVRIRRDHVFLDSYRSLFFKTGEEFKYSRLNIHFSGEEGVDAGGVSREWYSVLARQMFNPDYALFSPVASDRNTFHPNRMSSVNPDHLSYFKFTGRIIGKAIFDGRVMDAHFSRAVYKQMLGKSVSLKDVETLDLEYYNSLVWMLENDITDVITESFCIETDVFGQQQIIDLVPDGRNVPVTESNKHEYVRLMVQYKLQDSVKEQVNAFLTGFYDVIPKDLVTIFDEQELELMISGLPDIDIDDWRNNTTYMNYSSSSAQIQWFWRAVRSFDKEDRAKLLQFATGTAKMPLGGFADLEGMSGVQKFSLHRDPGSNTRLPQSHTCVNQVDLPEYESYEQLRSALLIAINEGSEGFGFA